MSNPNYEYKDGKIKVKIDDSWIEPSFKRYENIEPIGEPGANGVVIKGTHKITGRDDAIKIWLPRKRNGKNVIREEQYLAEVRKIAKLKDSRIVTIHDAWTENGCYCCSMDFVDGITYEKWLEKNYDMNTRVNMLLKIFEAIFFYQTQGIIHGDIHSRNILIDKSEEIHIIDFGTSSLSSYAEQSNHRENFLMYELVEKTLANQFDKKAFLYKKYSLQGDCKEHDDIRSAVPIFFSKSVLCYLHLIIMLTNLHDIINQPEDIYEYCRYIAKGFYLNMDYFYLKVSGENEQKLEMFTNIMFESLEDEAYEDSQNDSDEAEKMLFISLYAYFEEIKRGLNDGKLKEEIVEKNIKYRCLNKTREIVNIINKTSDLFEFHNILMERIGDYTEVYSIETDLRASFYNIIKETYGGYLLHILRYLNLRMEELKQQNELCDRIIRLSYVYCFNNGIDYSSNLSDSHTI